MFKLQRYFSITSLVAFAIVTIVLSTFYRQVALKDLRDLAERNNVALTKTFANSIWPEFGSFVNSASDVNVEDLKSHPENIKLGDAVQAQMAGLTILKVKVYNLNGLTVFSTEADQIGDDKSDNAGYLSAKSGEVASELTHRDTFSSFEGVIEDRDVISSYVPIYGKDTSNGVEGVFEIYDDVTDLLQKINTTQRIITIGVILTLGALYVALYFIIRRAELILKKMNSERAAAEKKLKESHTQLQIGVKDQTLDLEHRLGQIRSAAQISQLIAAEIDPQKLLQQVVDLIKDRFALYYAGVFLISEDNLFAKLEAGTGEAGRRMVAEGHKLGVGGSSMVGWATANRKARIAMDVGQEAIRFDNPHLPLTRTELALPLLRGKDPIGALTIQSTEPEAFDEDDIIVLQGIADSLATAIENAQFISKIEMNLNEINKLNQQYLKDAWDKTIESDTPTTITVESDEDIIEDENATYYDIPITLRDHQVIGNISLQSNRGSWSGEEKEFMKEVSNQAALALESARLLDESQNRVQREQTLNELTARFSRSLDVDSLMQTVVRELGKLPSVSKVSLHIAPPEVKELINSNGEQPEPERSIK